MTEGRLRTADGPASAAHRTYDHALHGIPGAWRGALAVLTVLGAGALLVGAAAVPVGSAVDVLLGGGPIDPARVVFTPGLWLAGNLLLALLVPISMLAQWLFFGVRPRWSLSVVGVFRWRWLARLAVALTPLWLVHAALLALVRPTGGPVASPEVLVLVAVALVTVPLQSAGEEFAFRGLVQRAVGSWSGRPAVAFAASTTVSGVLFAASHAPPDGWALAYYLTAAVALSVVVRSTGGLEAAVLVHAVSNLLVLLPLLLADDLAALGDRVAGPVYLVPTAAVVLTALLVRRQVHRCPGLVVRTGATPLRPG
jgi:membrane protease YdiL (CAAX protease family)